jgi:hypothetical protein
LVLLLTGWDMGARDPRGVEEEKGRGGMHKLFSLSDDLSIEHHKNTGDRFRMEGCVPRVVHSQAGGQATPNGLGAVGDVVPDVLRS